MKVLKIIALLTIFFTKFQESSEASTIKSMEQSDYLKYAIPKDTINELIINGQVLNIFNEPIDSLKIEVKVIDKVYSTFSNYDGFFRFEPLSESFSTGQPVSISLLKEDYKILDTVILCNSTSCLNDLIFKLSPKYKIFLRGRIMIGSIPLENVDVTVSYRGKPEHFKTLGCYIDEEEYTNCLYQGMFKTEIVTENPEDTIYLTFSRYGFKPLSSKLKFSEYSGDILKYKMKYTDTITNLPLNNFALNVSLPIGNNQGWFFGLSYYRQIKLGNFDRIMVGAEFTTITLNKSFSYSSLPNITDSQFDTTYVNLFAGPSLRIFLTKPNLKNFSTYIGSAVAFSFTDFEPVIQPFAGTRIFLDMRKSLSLEFRYVDYSLNIKEYGFNYLGNAIPSKRSYSNRKLLVNIGIQINF